MSLTSRIIGRFTKRGKALTLYKSGMDPAKRHDHHGAIENYTAVIDATGTSPEISAMALYNRALVFAASDRNANAIEDLNAVLAMVEANAQVKMEARRKLIGMERRSQGSQNS